MAIQIIDLEYGGASWEGAFGRKQRAGARELVEGFNAQGLAFLEASLGDGLLTSRAAPVLWAGIKKAVQAANKALGGVFAAEAEELAELTGASVGDILTANLAYDVTASGCSTFVQSTPVGPLHARNLDWDFPDDLLQRHTTIVRVEGAPAGPYATVSWPGLFGVLTGIAPGRFSVTVNFVQHASEGGLKNFAKRVAKGHWPVAWAVRNVMDEAQSFTEAVQMLKSVPLLAPVLFTVAGTRNGEGVVIERGTDSAATRRNPACVTNHYATEKFSEENQDLSEADTETRLSFLSKKLEAPVVDPAAALKLLSSGPLRRYDLQHQVVMEPRLGRLTVRVPGGRAVTVQL